MDGKNRKKVNKYAPIVNFNNLQIKGKNTGSICLNCQDKGSC